MTRARSTRRPFARRALLVFLMLVAGVLSASWPDTASAATAPTVYGRLWAQDTVFSTTLTSPTVANNVVTGGVLASPADTAHLSLGQLARVWIDCATLRALPASTPHTDLCGTDPAIVVTPVSVVLTSINTATGALTWQGYGFDLPPAVLPGARFDSVLWGPGNLSVDAAGRTYVVDTWNNRIAVFAPDRTPLYTIGHYGSVYSIDNDPSSANYYYPLTGAGATCLDALFNPTSLAACPNDPTKLIGLFNNPNDVSVFPDGTLVVADSSNHRIQLLHPNPNGSIVASDGVTRFSGASFGTWGAALGEPVGTMSFPGGVAAGANGRIAVADTDNSRIQIFDPASTGTVVASDGTRYTGFTFGQHGESDGVAVAFELNYPLDVALDPTGRIIVADSGNNQVKVYSPTGVDLALLGSVPDLNPGDFNYPWAASSDANGNLLVSDTFGQRVQVLAQTASGYDPNSPFVLPSLYFPQGAASTPDGGYVVTEFAKHRIVKLAPLGLTIQGSVTLSSASVASGSPVSATFSVMNTGMVPLTNVQPQLTGADIVACGNSQVPSAASLAVSATVQFTVCFNAGDPNTTMHMQVSATGSGGSMQVTAPPKSAPDISVLPAGAAIGIMANASASRVLSGSNFTVQVQLTNRGAETLTGVQLTIGTLQGITLVGTSPVSQPDIAVGASESTTLTFHAAAVGDPQVLTVTVTTNQVDPNTNLPARSSASVNVQVLDDITPPAITSITVTGPLGESPNMYNWVQYGPARLHISATDSGVGLSSINYQAITLQAESVPLNGQSSATFTSGPFNSVGQGNTLVAVWAEDKAGNSAAHGLVLYPGESVQSFCSRLPAQCAWVNVDPLKPDLRDWPVIFAPDNSSATVPFNATDSQSGVFTVATSSTNQPGTVTLTMDPGSNSRGNLRLTSEGPAVYGDVVVTDYAFLQNTFRLPLSGPLNLLPALRLDHTPPEGFNRVDPRALGARCTTTAPSGAILNYWCTNKMYGTDNLPGFTTSAIAPVSVEPVSWGGDDSSAGDPKFDGIAELHTYSFTDEYTPATGTKPYQNPNRVTLVEKVRQQGNEARVHVMSYQYTVGQTVQPVVTPDWAYKKYEWAYNSDNSLKTLNQKFELHRGLNRQQVLANYDGKSNTTTITDLGPYPQRRVVLPGLVLLKMTTWKGDLWILYPGSAQPADYR